MCGVCTDSYVIYHILSSKFMPLNRFTLTLFLISNLPAVKQLEVNH
jgi:hypothetical protein